MFRLERSGRLAAALVGGSALAGAVAWACMGWFPTTSLVESRRDEMLAAPPASFTARVQKLVPLQNAALKPEENGAGIGDWEREHLSAEQQQLVAQMRAPNDPARAEALGAALSPALRAYVVGAVAFHAAREADDSIGRTQRYTQAIGRFAAVKPQPGEPPELTVFAQYMLGRSHALRFADGDSERAVAAFRQTRALIVAGAADPLGLGVASYGEEATLALGRDDPRAAAQLYAQQAAHGSISGRNSLLMLAKRLSAEDRRDAALADPLLQRLVIIYWLEKLDDWAVVFDDDLDVSALLPGAIADSQEDAGEGDEHPALTLFRAIIARIETIGPEHWADTALLANAAYQAGRFDFAAQLARMRETPESDWILAKLAVRDGKLDDAAAFYARALDPELARRIGDSGYLFPGSERGETERERATAEWGVAQLGRGEFVEAYRLLAKAGSEYAASAAYVAERLLTTDELKTVVDQDFPPSPAVKTDEADRRWNRPPGTVQRLLLARRLMREDRYREAIRYFDGQTTEAAEDGAPVQALAALAERYANDRRIAAQGWRWRTTRAAAMFDAATLARRHGMELFGYEGAPDFQVWGGEFDFGGAQLPAAPGQGLVTREEQTRFDASVPPLPQRFHYRYRAVAEARQAAQWVPERSQAYAAMLCRATAWVIDREPPLAAEIYASYLRRGAYVPWGSSFGRDCPEPDFPRAEQLRRQQYEQQLLALLRRFKTPIVVLAGLLVAGLVSTLLIRRRAKRVSETAG